MITIKAITIKRLGVIAIRAIRTANTIRIKVQRIREARERIERLRTRIEQIRERIERIRNSPITQAWGETPEGAIFLRTIQTAAGDIAAMAGLFGRLVGVLQQSASDFESTQQRVVGQAEQLSGARR